MNQTANVTTRKANCIGFLRLLFASFVVLSHTLFLGAGLSDPLSQWTHGAIYFGQVGVQGFFVLSGWLVTISFQRSASVGRFFWHRILRLGPALWVCLFVTAFVLAPVVFLTSPHHQGSYFSLDPRPVTYWFKNLIIPRKQIFIGKLLSDNPWPLDWNGSLWTLFYEGSCYFMVAAIGIFGLLKRLRLLGLILLCSIIACYLLIIGTNPHWLPLKTARLFDTPGKIMCVHFVSGMIWALLPDSITRLLTRSWLVFVFMLFLLASWYWNFHALVTPLVLAPIVFWLAEHLHFKNYEVRLGGDYSYGLYIYSYPVLQTLAHFGVQSISLWLYGSLGVICAGSLAILSWRLIEAPALSLKSIPFRFGKANKS